jgi:hypothetical protein
MVVPTDALRRAALNSTPRAAPEEEGGRGRKKSDDDDDEDRTRCCSAALEQEEEENLLLVRRIEEQLADDDDDDDDEDENDVEARAKTLMMLSFYDASRCGESLTEIGKEKRIFLLETSPFAHRASLSSVRSKRRAREARRREKIPRERKRLHFF